MIEIDEYMEEIIKEDFEKRFKELVDLIKPSKMN